MINIITINKNNLVGLIRTVDSILNQSEFSFKWIIIDGNSTDGSIEFINKIEFENLLVIIENDNGIYDAMNKGIDQTSKEDLVWFVNSGDFLANKEIVKLINDNYLGFDIIYGNYTTFKDVNLNSNSMNTIKNPISLDVLWLYKKTINHQSYLIKSSLLKKYKFETNYKICADWVQLFNILWNEKKLEVFKINEVLINYEIGGLSERQNDLRLKERDSYLNSMFSEVTLNSFNKASSIATKNEYSRILNISKSKYRWRFFRWVLRLLSR